jgi:hypothetical protein
MKRFSTEEERPPVKKIKHDKNLNCFVVDDLNWMLLFSIGSGC